MDSLLPSRKHLNFVVLSESSIACPRVCVTLPCGVLQGKSSNSKPLLLQNQVMACSSTFATWATAASTEAERGKTSSSLPVTSMFALNHCESVGAASTPSSGADCALNGSNDAVRYRTLNMQVSDLPVALQCFVSGRAPCYPMGCTAPSRLTICHKLQHHLHLHSWLPPTWISHHMTPILFGQNHCWNASAMRCLMSAVTRLVLYLSRLGVEKRYPYGTSTSSIGVCTYHIQKGTEPWCIYRFS